jgi:hypothetical protein
MAYYIFLKSLRSLEEFRKNPHVKIPPKSPSTNFQSLDKFKNPILIQKFFFFALGPANLAARSASGPASPPAAPYPQVKPSRPAHPARASVASSWEIRFPFWFAPSRAGRLSLVSPSSGPRLSAIFPTAPTDPGRFQPSPLATPRHLTSDLEMPGEVFTPRLDSPP